MRQLHPKARWLFRLRAYFSLLIPVIVLSSFFFGILMSIVVTLTGNEDSSFVGGLFLVGVFLCIILILLFGEIYARMSYNRWFYEFEKDTLRLERGIIWKKYSNIPYERIQNVDVRRGIIARLFGFSEIEIQTAGYSMPSYGRRRNGLVQHSEGYLPGVDMNEAERIREFVMKKIRHN